MARWLGFWFAIFVPIVAISRLNLAYGLAVLERRGALREKLAVVGHQIPRNLLADRLASSADIVGLYDADPLDQVTDDDMAQLLEFGREGVMDSVIIADEATDPAELAQLAERLKALPVEIRIAADEFWLQSAIPDLRMVGDVPLAVVADQPIKQSGQIVKRIFDALGALFLLIILSPLMFMIALAIRSTSEGSIIFRQPRQGWCGKTFVVFKFRTMCEPLNNTVWMQQTSRNDVRCTPVGKVLRLTSLDELPQLWNVLRGEMSLVGPRPHADYLHGLDKAGREIVAQYAQRRKVKPGITGWAQIHGSRGATRNPDQLRQRVAYDLYYIENWSIWLDLQILARTAFCLLGENVY